MNWIQSGLEFVALIMHLHEIRFFWTVVLSLSVCLLETLYVPLLAILSRVISTPPAGLQNVFVA